MATLETHRSPKRANRQAPDQGNRPSRGDAEEAVRTLIQWARDNPDREGLPGTPARVVRACEEWFAGSFEDPRDYSQRTCRGLRRDDAVARRAIRIHCEHHLAPIVRRIHIGYLSRDRVVGIATLVRLVDVYAKRLQVQEKTTAGIDTA